MNIVDNPFAPGAGTPPPELAGRDDLRERARTTLARLRRGRPTKSILMVGLRGVGKTVLLERMNMDADAAGFYTIRVEAPEKRSLPALLTPQFRQTLLRLSRNEKAKELADRALRALAGFVQALRIRYSDIEIGLTAEPEPGLADNGDLELDLQSLIEAVGEAAQSADTGVVLFVDELQYIDESQLAALITALHRTAQRSLPVTMIGAGLPQLRGRAGHAQSYAERLFDYPDMGALNDSDARIAIQRPLEVENVAISDEALDRIINETRRYPYFLQEWGKHVWDVADASPIDGNDVASASELVVAALDESFFRVRFDQLTPAERRYLRAMAELGPGPHRSGDIADTLDRKVTSLGPVRSALIGKGMAYSPHHGDTAFTVPLFDSFMRRIMPGNDW